MNPLFLLLCVLAGLLMALLDGILNANPFAARMYAAYQPIARPRMNIGAALAIDITQGILMGVIFIIIHNSLPGGSELLKGLSFGLLAWFFRVLMQAASQWVMFNVPLRSLLYMAASGLAEMLVMGLFYGLILPLA